MSEAAGSGPDGLLLARHGQTDDNIEPIRAQGFRDTPLNATGRVQAQALGELLSAREQPPRSLFASDLSRAAQTAQIVGRLLGLEPQLDRRLREGNRGRWEGRLFIEIAREEPDAYAAWMRAGASFRFPGGESLGEHAARVWTAVSEIRARAALPALVVCHGGSIRTLLCRSDPRGLAAFHSFKVPNAGVVAL